MKDTPRLDLATLPEHVRSLVEALVEENRRLKEEVATLRARHKALETGRRPSRTSEATRVSVVPKPKYPHTVMVVELSERGLGKRTPINAYMPQHRGGLGVYDITVSAPDVPRHLLIAEEAAAILCMTNRGRAFRVPVSQIPMTDLRERGVSLAPHLTLGEGEVITAATVLDDSTPGAYLFILSEEGWVRRLCRHYVGPRMGPGTALHDICRGGGVPRALFLGDENRDLLLVTRKGMGIRFPVVASSARGGRGILLQAGDEVVGGTLVRDEDVVLLVTAGGQGARRLMSAFAPNRSPGGEGKLIMRAADVVAVARVEEGDEVFCLSRFARITRFPVQEVPAREGPVEGVAVMDVRGDEVTAVAVSTPPQLAGR